jgi:hypothetical protein
MLLKDFIVVYLAISPGVVRVSGGVAELQEPCCTLRFVSLGRNSLNIKFYQEGCVEDPFPDLRLYRALWTNNFCTFVKVYV